MSQTTTTLRRLRIAVPMIATALTAVGAVVLAPATTTPPSAPATTQHIAAGGGGHTDCGVFGWDFGKCPTH